MSDHDCVRCPQCDSCPACAADALDREVVANDELRAALAAAERELAKAKGDLLCLDEFAGEQMRVRKEWEARALAAEATLAHIGTGAGLACRLAMNGRLPQEGQE